MCGILRTFVRCARKCQTKIRKMVIKWEDASDFDETLSESIYLGHEESFGRGPEAVRGQNNGEMMDFR